MIPCFSYGSKVHPLIRYCHYKHEKGRQHSQQLLYRKIEVITCLAYGLHRIIKQVHVLYSRVYKLVLSVEHVFFFKKKPHHEDFYSKQ